MVDTVDLPTGRRDVVPARKVLIYFFSRLLFSLGLGTRDWGGVTRPVRLFLRARPVIQFIIYPASIGFSLKADLDGKIFAYDYRAQLACVMTSRQIASCKC